MPLTPDEVYARTFQATKFHEGYDQAEVDDFLDEVVAELRRLHQDNDELRERLAVCEKRAADLSHAVAGSAPTQRDHAAVSPVPTAHDDTAQDATTAPAPPDADLAHAAPPSQPHSGVQEAAGMLALAQRLHDEHVRTGERERDRLVGEAEKKKSDTLNALERERRGLEQLIDTMKDFERAYRNQLKSYLQTQLRDLEAQESLLPGTPPDESPASHR